jgi:hypothetical protein
VVALEAWYDIDDEEPITVRTVDDVDTLFDRMVADAADFDVPPLSELSRHDADGWVVAYVGVNPKHDRGIVTHSDATGSVISFSGLGSAGSVTYDYMGSLRELPASAEIPLDEVRQAMREFVTTNGTRPISVSWRISE